MNTDSGVPQPSPDVVFRRSAWRRLLDVSLSGAIGLLLLCNLATSRHASYKVAGGAAALLFGYIAIRAARAAIFAGADHLVVRDVYRTYRIGWQEIARFEAPPRWGTWRKIGLRIHLRNGQVIAVIAYARGLLDTGRPEEAAVLELEQLRRQRTGNPTST